MHSNHSDWSLIPQARIKIKYHSPSLSNGMQFLLLLDYMGMTLLPVVELSFNSVRDFLLLDEIEHEEDTRLIVRSQLAII